jgi:hypothetical protein
MSFTKLRDGRSVYALDSLRLRTRKQANTAPQAGTVELFIRDGILYQVDEQGVSKEASVTPVVGKFYLPANQLIAKNTTVVIGVSTAAFETHSLVNGSGTSTKISPPLAGKYRVSAKLLVMGGANWLNGSSGAMLQLWLAVNNQEIAILSEHLNITGNMALSFSGSTIVDLKANDYIELRFKSLSNTGSATIVGNSTGLATYLDIDRVGF